MIPVQDQELTQMVKSKTGIELSTFYISESEKVWGMMAGIPGKPTMLLSKPLYECFNKDELQFVVLHELGHYASQHSIKELVVSLTLLGAGFFILKRMKTLKAALVTSVCLGILFGLLALQCGKFNEYEADQYAMTRMDNPEGAVQAAYRFKEAYNQPDKETLMHILLFRRIPYYERINTARKEIEARE